MSKHYEVRSEEKLVREVDRLAARNKRSRNQEINAALEWWLSQQEIVAGQLRTNLAVKK